MSWGAVSSDHWAESTRLAPEKDTFASEATAAEFLLVEISTPRPTVRGRLRLALEGAIERALEGQGAPPPAVAAPFTFDRTLDDLLRRARVAGASGIALWIPSLRDIATASVLDPDDSGTLRAWLSASREKPVKLGFDEGNLPLAVYLEPCSLASLLAPEPTLDSSVDSTGDDAARSETSSASEPSSSEFSESDAPDRTLRDSTASPDPEPSDPAAFDADETDETDETALAQHESDALAESARAMAEELGDEAETGWLKDALMELSTPPPRPVADATDEDEADLYERGLGFLPPPVAPRLEIAFAEPHEVPVEAEPEPEPSRVDSAMLLALESYCHELEAANGPKPLTVVERLFTSAYLPLRTAVDRHPELPQRLREVADEWARSFDKSYSDAFDALRTRTKRPSMVVDVPDLALRIGRLHGARSTQLLLVDGMRFDLGEAVHERLREHVGQRAACAERYLLWAALPTTTAAQVELIGRGPAGLKDFTGEVNSDLVVARGRKASMIRRLRAGHRELLKLDVVEARVTEPGGADPSGFDAIADEAAARIAAHFETLQPRTLVMVFGDHGFAVDRADGMFEARQGGASPEEVLVPAFAWLVGAVH